MRQTQIFIRIVVFCCVALDPSGGGAGIAYGVVIGLVIGVAVSGVYAKNAQVKDDETN